MSTSTVRFERIGVLGVVVFCYAAVGVSVGAIPAAVQQAGGGPKAVGVAMGSYAFTAIAARVGAGVVMRRTGLRPILAGACIGLAGATALSAVPNTSVIVAARLLLGVAVGALMASSTAWVVELPSATSQVARSIASIGTVNYAVLALGAPVGLWLTQRTGPHSALLVAGAFPVVALLLLAKLTAPNVASAQDTSGSTARPDWHRILGSSVGPGVALMFSGFGYAALVSFGAQLLQERGLGGGNAVVATFGVTMVLTRVVFGSVTDRIATAVVTAIAFAAEGVGMIVVVAAHTEAVMFAGVVMVGVTMALIYPMLGAMVAGYAGRLRGSALSLYGAFINLGIGGGSYVIGWISEHDSITTGYVTAAVALFAGSVVTLITAYLVNRTSQNPRAPRL